MKFLRVTNLAKHQHYKDRCPPWIKLHREVLDDYEFSCLPDASKAHLMLIWLLASATKNRIRNDARWVGQRIGAQSPVDLAVLIEGGFLQPCDDGGGEDDGPADDDESPSPDPEKDAEHDASAGAPGHAPGPVQAVEQSASTGAIDPLADCKQTARERRGEERRGEQKERDASSLLLPPAEVPARVRLTVAANQGVEATLDERGQTNPFNAGHGDALALAEMITGAGIDIEIACRSVFTQAKRYAEKHRKRPRTLAYFAEGVREHWADHQADIARAGAAVPEELPGAGVGSRRDVRGASPSRSRYPRRVDSPPRPPSKLTNWQ